MKKTDEKQINKKLDKKIKTEVKEVSLITTKSNELVVIKSDADIVKAAEFLVFVKDKINSLEDERQLYTKPINESLKRLNSRFKSLTEPLKEAERAVKDAIIKYKAEREEQRLKDQDKLQKKNGDMNIALIDSVPDIVESKSGEIRTTRRWVFEIVEVNKVPKEYLMIDSDKVNEAISEGIRNIPGLKIYQKEDLSVYGNKHIN